MPDNTENHLFLPLLFLEDDALAAAPGQEGDILGA